MKFSQSGLPKHKIVEEAFAYSHANTMALQNEALKNFQQQIDMAHSQNMMMLDMEKQAGAMKEDEYKQQKILLERMRSDQLKAGPALVADELEKMFESRRLAPALEIVGHSEKAAPELIAAVMLIDCVRSPVDYQRIVKTFGENIAGLIAEIVHIDAYPSERDANLMQAGVDTKRAYMALLITSLDQITAQIARTSQDNPMQRIMFPPGQEEQLHGNARLMWGNDAKLDKRFIDSFNRASDAASSSYKMEVDADGKLELVKGSFKNPNIHPPFPGGPGPGKGLGDDVF